MSSSLIPSGAADRIIRNPHCLPHVPQILAGEVERNRHRDRLRQHAEEAYRLRRSRLEDQRLRRISASRSEESLPVTISPSPSPPPEETMGKPKPRRSQSWSIPTSSFVTRRASSFTTDTPFSKHVYYTPSSSAGVDSDLLKIPKRQSATTTTTIPRRHSFNNVSNPHNLSPKLRDKNPYDRIRHRCHFMKRPSPGWKSRDFVLNKDGRQWTSHPCWHRIMRDEYKYNGLDQQWRQERNRFLQEFRRDRQFERQTARRFSNTF